MRKKNTLGLLAIIILVGAVAFVGISLTQPAYALTMDVNPSIEIVSNRLNRVVEVNPLNEDAKEMLKDFSLKDKNLQNTVEDLADLMILKGYISGGKDNVVMITVDDNAANQDAVNDLNRAIAAYLENKQIEATIVNQKINEEYEGKTAKELVASKISKADDILDYEKLSNMTLRELVALSEARGIDSQALFSNILKTERVKRSDNQFIGDAKAKELALELVNGEIIKFELDDRYDDDDDNPEYEIEILANGYKYEIELDAYTGRVLEFEKDDYDRDDKKVKPVTNSALAPAKKQVIGERRAKEIALGLVNGTIVKFELDDDDDDDREYEIEIIANGYEYEIEIDAYTGRVIEFERDDYDDDNKDVKNSKPVTNSSPAKKQVIGEARAKEIALGLVNGTIVEFEFDNDDDDPEYEIEIIANGYEYEIEIDAYTGKVLEFERDD